jgi:hypothetical protein
MHFHGNRPGPDLSFSQASRADSEHLHHKMRGQSLVFEQVMLFFMGVMIFTITVTFFMAYQSHVITQGTYDQLNEVASHLTWSIINLAQKDYQENSTLTITIPGTAGQEVYEMELSGDGLLVRATASGSTVFSNLCMLNQTMSLSGETSSADDTVIIYKKGNEIIIS